MGNNCTNCCNNIEKKLKQMTEDEVELKINNNRQNLIHNNLSMIVEDAYESQLSQQNSHLGISMQVQSNTLNSINTCMVPNNNNLSSFWILDIQERLVIVSNVNEPNLHMKIQVSFNEQTEEFCLFEEIACIGSNSTNSSLTSLNLKGQSAGNTPGLNLKDLNTYSINTNTTPGNAQNNNVSQEQLKFIQNKKYHCYPFERQISQFYQIHFERQEAKKERISDFQTLDDMQFTIIETWKEILRRIFKLAGIQNNSNVVIINNFLRFARQASQLNTIAEMLLKFVFESLKVARFSICSSGVPILKFVNKKNGIVFDILESGYIFCLPVNQGSSQDSKFRILYSSPNNSFLYKCDTDFISSQGQINQIQVIPTQQNNSTILQAQSQALAASASSMQQKKNDSIQKDILDFLDSLDHEFALNCFKSQSVVINNQCKNEFIHTSILQVLNQFYLTLHPAQEDQIMNLFQPIIPKQPRNTRVMGTADLLKLNVIETISKSRYDRLGAVEIIKQNIFL